MDDALNTMNPTTTSEDDTRRIRSASYHNPSRLLRRASHMDRVLADSQVIVVVRIRPLNTIEKEAESSKCTNILGPGTIEINTGASEREPKIFNLDAVVHDEAPQQDLFQLTAKHILTRVFSGFNGCIFAYGQTGSGKTYSMIGGNDVESEGVIPRTVRELFAKIEQEKNNKTYVVKGSFVEIYQEKLKDLLYTDDHKGSTSTKPPLLIRHDTSPGGKGIYVTGVHERMLLTTQDVLTLLEDGMKTRTVGSTNMNATSSRSHAVLSLLISCQDADDVEGYTRTVAKLHLVDLAGSERAKATGATGARLKEGASINKSLAALGNVVNSLTSKGKRSHTPYRDSKLTRLLQDSLGGNAYTLMICCVSPATMNSAETQSSLRFAERTKKIQNKAIINRDPKLNRIAELTEENSTLKERITQLEFELEQMKNQIEEMISSKVSARTKGTATVSPAASLVLQKEEKGSGCCVVS